MNYTTAISALSNDLTGLEHYLYYTYTKTLYNIIPAQRTHIFTNAMYRAGDVIEANPDNSKVLLELKTKPYQWAVKHNLLYNTGQNKISQLLSAAKAGHTVYLVHFFQDTPKGIDNFYIAHITEETVYNTNIIDSDPARPSQPLWAWNKAIIHQSSQSWIEEIAKERYTIYQVLKKHREQVKQAVKLYDEICLRAAKIFNPEIDNILRLPYIEFQDRAEYLARQIYALELSAIITEVLPQISTIFRKEGIDIAQIKKRLALAGHQE